MSEETRRGPIGDPRRDRVWGIGVIAVLAAIAALGAVTTLTTAIFLAAAVIPVP